MSYRIYPVTKTAPFCDDYRVKVCGVDVATNTARVSAVPFNRRWPGHQRDISQTEAVQFLSLAADEPLTFEIIPKAPFREVKIRPQSLGITPTVEGGSIRFTLRAPAYLTVEPYGRERALHIFVDPMRDYGVDPADPHVRYFGPGEHDAGLIELSSNETLYLAEGAVVYASVYACDAENIRLLGHGILDNSKNKEEILFAAHEEGNEEAVQNVYRRHTVQLEYCTGVEIDGITVRDSLVYNIRPIGCRDLSIRNVKLIGCWRYNSDGIDMHNCVGVRIADCFLRTFDDAICVKGFDCYQKGDVAAAVRAAMYRGGKAYDVFCDALIERCVVWNDWGRGLEIGAETKAEQITDITFRDCDLIHLTGAALDCTNVDYADVHHVTYRDIRIECDEEIPAPRLQRSDGEVYENPSPAYQPDIISVSTLYHPEYSRGSGERRGRCRDITFENIRILGDRLPRVRCAGYDEAHRTERIRIRGLYLGDTPLTSLPAGKWAIGDHCAEVTLEGPYTQLAANTVASDGQLSEGEGQSADRGGRGTRILFVGNSITLHGIRPEVGWYHVFGMAASAAERDYVHLVERAVLEADPEASFKICQVAEWERAYAEGERLHEKYRDSRDFAADIIIVRCIENCPWEGFDGALFERQLDALLSYLDKEKKASLLVTTGFWRHPGDAALRAYARERGCPCIELGDLGEDDAMKATGLFAHRGVANHPGDLGMQTIAERLRDPLLALVEAARGSRQ